MPSAPGVAVKLIDLFAFNEVEPSAPSALDTIDTDNAFPSGSLSLSNTDTVVEPPLTTSVASSRASGGRLSGFCTVKVMFDVAVSPSPSRMVYVATTCPTKVGMGAMVTTEPATDTVASPDTLDAEMTESPPGVSSGSLSFASTLNCCGVAGPKIVELSGTAMGAWFARSVMVTRRRPSDTAPPASETW